MLWDCLWCVFYRRAFAEHNIVRDIRHGVYPEDWVGNVIELGRAADDATLIRPTSRTCR